MSRPGPFAPVVALDIDGTSGDYHGHFTKFIQDWTGREMPSPNMYTGGVHFSKHLGVSRKTYNEAKLAYRQGGMKRSMPAYPGIGEFTRDIRKNGVQLWICTTRPYLRLDNIDPDTRHWLRRNHLQYDNILYGEYKYRDLARAVGRDRVVMVYDDLPKMIEQAASSHMPACLRRQPYNTYWEGNDRFPVARNVADMWVVFDKAINEWRNNHA